jgi:hypothetical protein
MIKAGVPVQEAIDRGPLCCHCTNLLRPIVGDEELVKQEER